MSIKNIFRDLLSPLQESPTLPNPKKSDNNKNAFGKNNQTSTRKETKAKTQNSSKMQTITINKYAIRIFSYESQRYYCVEDLAKASKMANPQQFLKDFLTKNPKLSSDLAEVETEEDGKNTTLQFATKEQLTPMIEVIEVSLTPGR